MEIKITIKKTHFYILAFLLVAAIAFSYDTTTPQFFGHTASEVDITVDTGKSVETKLLHSILSEGKIPIKIQGQKTTLQDAITSGDIVDKNQLASEIDEALSGRGVAAGSYVGGGQPSRTVTIAGRPETPKAIWVVRTDGNGMPFYRINNMALHDECGDNTERWCVVTNPGNNLKTIEGGFIVMDTGNIHSTNKAGVSYEYMVFY